MLRFKHPLQPGYLEAETIGDCFRAMELGWRPIRTDGSYSRVERPDGGFVVDGLTLNEIYRKAKMFPGFKFKNAEECDGFIGFTNNPMNCAQCGSHRENHSEDKQLIPLRNRVVRLEMLLCAIYWKLPDFIKKPLGEDIGELIERIARDCSCEQAGMSMAEQQQNFGLKKR